LRSNREKFCAFGQAVYHPSAKFRLPKRSFQASRASLFLPTAPSIDHLVALRQHRGRDAEVKRSGDLLVDGGVQIASAVRLSNNDIIFNNSAISGATGTYGNNRLSDNVSPGTVSTPNGSGSGEFA
jgi:hypothetical protein